MFKFFKLKNSSHRKFIKEKFLISWLEASGKTINFFNFRSFSKNSELIDISISEKIDKSYLNLNIPKTSFNERLSSHDNELKNITRISQEFYREQLKDKNRKLWVTHECPSIPDGSPHLGILYNRIIKDSLNRLKIMQGYKVHYNLGFECYGIRIEDRVMDSKNVSSFNL
jgi:hypothetical protein